MRLNLSIQNFVKDLRDHVHEIGPNFFYNVWITILRYNKKLKEFEMEPDLQSSVYIKGNGVESMCVPKKDLILAKMMFDNLLLVIKNWNCVQKIQLECTFSLSQHMLLNGFDIDKFPFMFYYNERTIEIINL